MNYQQNLWKEIDDIVNPKILKKLKPGQNGEIHITDAIRTLIHQNNKFIGHIFAGKYLDCGTMQGYIQSTIDISKS